METTAELEISGLPEKRAERSRAQTIYDALQLKL